MTRGRVGLGACGVQRESRQRVWGRVGLNPTLPGDKEAQVFDDLLQAVRRAFAPVPEAAPFLADWPDTAERRVLQPSALPVCQWLDGMGRDGVLGPLRAVSHRLQWRQTYGAGDFGADFLNGYGWSEFIGLRGPVPSDRIACGVLLLAPGITYPAHAHQAEEVYLPIHGRAEWQKGDAAFAPVPVGQAIHHPSWVSHAMRVRDEPLAALYLWRGGDLAAKSVILG